MSAWLRPSSVRLLATAATGVGIIGWNKNIVPVLRAEEQKKLQIDLPPKKRTNKTTSSECIIVVGTTGTGKSSTISKYTGQDAPTSSGADSQTRRCTLYADLRDAAGPDWIDTVGYDDTRHLSDKDSFREVLGFIDAQDVRDVRAIIWTVQPQERKDARLQRQADFINQFKDGEVWSNVIVVAKQPGSFNLDQACQGAIEAAKQHAGQNSKNIAIMGFTYLDDSIPKHIADSLERLPKEVKDKMLLVSDQDVYEKLKEKIDSIEEPIQVIFRDSKCLDCSVVGDRRLLGKYCHFELLLQHPKQSYFFHPKETESYHALDKEAFHPGVLRVVGGPHKQCEDVRNVLIGTTAPLAYIDVTSGLVAAGLSMAAWKVCSKMATPVEERFSCCEGNKHSNGCQIRWRCCRQDEISSGCTNRYECCKGSVSAQGCLKKYECCQKLDGHAGCEEVCRKCGAPWGSETQNCFVKDHNLVLVTEEELKKK